MLQENLSSMSLSVLIINMCLMCNVSADVSKKCKSEGHFIITYKECVSKYPDSRETHL